MSLKFAPLPQDLRVSDLDTVYFIGIGGAGMSVIARMFHASGAQVKGADSQSNETTASLTRAGIEVFEGHQEHQVAGCSAVVVSSAVRESNPELSFARTNGLTILHRSQALALLMRERTAIAVAGAHGKTSTSAMIAVGAQGLGLNPSFAIGSSVLTSTGALPGGKLGTGDVLIAEADESDGTFLNYEPYIAVITNVEADHLDHYGTEANFEQAFVDFAAKVPASGALVICLDDPGAARIAKGRTAGGARVITYGQHPDSDLRIVSPHQARGEVGISSAVQIGSALLGTPPGSTAPEVALKLAVPGVYNLLNATAALGVLLVLGQEPQRAAQALSHFQGTGRRFELRGTVGSIRVFDDYAHHPTEVTALMAAARTAAGSGRVLTLFQPHLFSRTKAFTREFADALSASDVTVLTGIYGAREDFDPTVSAQDIAQLMTAPVAVENDRDQAAQKIAQLAQPNDLILTVGAGDVTELGSQILDQLHARQPDQARK